VNTGDTAPADPDAARRAAEEFEGARSALQIALFSANGGEAWRRFLEVVHRSPLPDLTLGLADGYEKLKAECADLMRVLEAVLIEVEPLMYEQKEEIERKVAAKKKWAEVHNRTCGNSNEMWFYSTEFRRALENDVAPLKDAVREANNVFDRISAACAETPAPE
jgi:hypothetical protein